MSAVRIRQFLLRNRVTRFATSSVVQILLPAVSGAYFLTLDVWGTDLAFVKDHVETHKVVFGFLLLFTLLSQILKALQVHYSEKNVGSYNQFLEDFMILTAKVVEFKLERFRSNAKKLKPNGDAFKAITQPADQITYIISQSLATLRPSFGLSESQLSMTIIQMKEDGDRTFYAFEEPQGWNRTKARKIMSSTSAAASCAESGEPLFYADKEKAASDGRYFLSGRDRSKKIGSIYCYPVFVKTPEATEKFVISITSYEKRICSPADDDAIKIAQTIFREVCRRIELELTLLAMRQWKFKE